LGLHAQDEQPQPEPKAEQEEEVAMPSLSIEQALNLSMPPSRMVRADPRKHC
jgi:heterodisulfide reductase subunit B